MKTLKLMLAAIFISFAVASMGGISPTVKSSKCVKLDYQHAVHKPGLVNAMRAQLNPAMLCSNSKIYTARVSYKGVNYLITGTTKQWTRFFRLGTDPTIRTAVFQIGKH